MATIKDSLTIVIVCFNSGEVIASALGDLIDDNCCPIIIVDNNSTDDSENILRARFKHINIIQSSKNIGYGRAANLGFKAINTEYVLLLNPDVLLTSDVLKKVFINAKNSDERQVVFSPALDVNSFTKKGNQVVDYLIGAFLLFKYDSLKEVGFFDENFFLFYEEKDIELRLINNDCALVLQTDLYVEHLTSASSGNNEDIYYLRNWHVAWSKLYYSYKHGLYVRDVTTYLLVCKYFFKSIIHTGNKKVKYKARFDGALAYLRGESAFSAEGSGKHSDRV